MVVAAVVAVAAVVPRHRGTAICLDVGKCSFLINADRIIGNKRFVL